jgi:hypothetical protein
MFSLGKWTFRILLLANLLNPLIPHISNFVSSDALFAALSLIWFTQLLWLIYKPTRNLLIIHGLILLLAFMVRYNALYYPTISFLVIMLTKLSPIRKTICVGYMTLLLWTFVGATRHEYDRLYGASQFSAFGGWQIASNSLYGYAHSQLDPVEKVPKKFRKLHAMVNMHMDSIRRLKIRPDKEVAIYYLWNFKSPLRIYMDRESQLLKDSNAVFLEKWALVAPLYAEYGRYIIVNHPNEFLKYYTWPNLIKYFVPPANFMDSYNMGSNKVNKTIARWFGWKNQDLPLRFKSKAIQITSVFAELNAVINLVYFLGLMGFCFLGGLVSSSSKSKRIIFASFFVWFSNMIFSVLAAPIELRYLIFPFILTFSFSIILVAYIGRVSKGENSIKKIEDFNTTKHSETTIQLL